MDIRVEIRGTEPLVKEGTYVYCTGDLSGVDLHTALEDLESYILRSLKDLRKLKAV